jgi:hypothetical protein
MLCDSVDCRADRLDDVARSARTALINVLKNFIKVGERPLAVVHPSCDAVTLPERSHLFVGRKAAPQRLIERGIFFIAQYIDAGPAGFDLARHLDEFFLIFLRPVFYSAQNLFGVLGHAKRIPNQPDLCQQQFVAALSSPQGATSSRQEE